MFTAMIFDLDGVIADTHPIHKRAWRQLLIERKERVSEEQIDFVLEGRTRREILTHFFGNLSPSEIAICGRRKDELFYECAGELRPIPGVVELLAELDRAGVPKAVATSASRQRAHFVLELLDLTGQFSVVLTGDDVAHGKPDPAVFALVANRLKVAPQQSVVAEDSGCGVRAAKSAGMRCLGVGRGAHTCRLRQEGADYVVNDFKGLSLSALQALF